MHSFEVFHRYERSSWTLGGIPWGRLARDRVRPEYVTLAKSAVMGECNSIAAVHGFLNEFVDDYDFSAYVSIWGYQELQHHYAFRTWLKYVGVDVDPRPVAATRAPYPPGITPASTLATNVISELTVCHVYHFVSDHVEEPVLRQVLRRASQDEARHASEFFHYAKRRLERYPAEVQSVLETLYVYTTDPARVIKHPVSVFKGALPELE
ncbi:MAG TPA: ferritin-like domain-containing protein, partial [Methylomirabilota bacterium]|nr:ferritin-like domain-containing protein [Methylomirabilota bacterium]